MGVDEYKERQKVTSTKEKEGETMSITKTSSMIALVAIIAMAQALDKLTDAAIAAN